MVYRAEHASIEADRLPRGVTPRRVLVAHLFVLPLAIALVFTTARVGHAAVMPWVPGLLLWLGLVVPVWWVVEALSHALHRLLRPWAPPLWAICTIASIAQALLLSPWYRVLYQWVDRYAHVPVASVESWPEPALTVVYVGALLRAIAPGALVWIGVNYFYDRVLGVPRFRYPGRTTPPSAGEATSPGASPPASLPAAPDAYAAGSAPANAAASAPANASDAAPSPTFVARSRLPAECLVLAVTAEEHYVRIHSDRGRDLVRYKFSDALEELAAQPSGMQVHRSWWVRLDQVRTCLDRGRSCELELPEGTRVPVSLAFREAVLQRLPSHVRRVRIAG
jgi:hypothetical protein